MSLNSRTASFVFVLVLLLTGYQLLHYLPQLPDKVPSHFNASGQPDDWLSKKIFAVFYIGIFTLMTLVFYGLIYLIRKMPDATMNLPNKSYWLAPERRSETETTLTTQITWLGSATLFFLLLAMHASIRVALDRNDALGKEFWVLFIGYLVFTVLWSINLIRSFKDVPQ